VLVYPHGFISVATCLCMIVAADRLGFVLISQLS
jgi:hypothetical protein